MSTGTSALGICYASQAEAASAWCSGVNVGTSSGLMTCQSVDTSLASNAGGVALFSWTSRLVPPASSNGSRSVPSLSQVAGQRLAPCETYGPDYWAPYVAAALALFVAVFCVRRMVELFHPAED